MNRRNWLKCFSALIPAWLIRADRQDGYFYECTADGMVTDDPNWADRSWRPGIHNRTTCNGKEILWVKRLKTGRDGWVECCVKRPNGNLCVFDPSEITIHRVYGQVEFSDQCFRNRVVGYQRVRPEQKGPESEYWAEKVIAVS